MTTALHLLSGGAAQGIVRQVAPAFEQAHGVHLHGGFGAVGAMKQKLLEGAPCDVLILTQALIDGLTQSGQVRAGTAHALGTVMTSVAVKSGQKHPPVHDGESLRQALSSASGIYFPDPKLATAGIHFMKVLTDLGIAQSLSDRLRVYPNGATAMKAMAECDDPHVMGCTQITEILITEGIECVADLPPGYELATVYTAAVCSASPSATLAAQFIEALTGQAAQAWRRQAGFLPMPA